MAELGEVGVKVVVDAAVPFLVRFINRQFPTKRADKWDERIQSYILTVLSSAAPPAGDESDPDPDLNHFMILAEQYEEARNYLAALDEAHDAGGRNYLVRRTAAGHVAFLGKKLQVLSVSTSTILAHKQLCRKAGHPQPCPHCHLGGSRRQLVV